MKTFIALLACLALAACSQAQIDTANKDISAAAATGAVVLTDAQKTACLAQGGAVVAANIATIAGSKDDAMNAGKAAQAAAMICQPPAPAPQQQP